MSKNLKTILVFSLLLFIYSLPNLEASAQIVDPCGYGCPKPGCPNCPEGGPINLSNAPSVGGVELAPVDININPIAYNQDTCISSCDMQYDSCIKRGNTNEYCGGQLDECHKGCIQDR